MKNILAISKFILAILLTVGIGVIACFVTLHKHSAEANHYNESFRLYSASNCTIVAQLEAHIPSSNAATTLTATLSPAKTNLALPKVLPGLPLAFVENRGQVDMRAAFHVQGHNTAAYFTVQGLTMTFTQPSALHASNTSPAAASSRQSSVNHWNLKLDFVGADSATKPEGKHLTPARVSYFSGPPQQWRTGLRTYAKLVYRNLWPGIDLVYSGTTNRLKYEFIVKPGANPQQIRLAYRGTSAPLAVNAQGQLEIPTPFGGLKDDQPVAFQRKGKAVETGFVVYERAADGSQAYGFKVGKYDRRKTLVIDPAILVYSGFLGGSGDDEGHSIAVDRNGYAYVTGVTTSTQASFPEVAGPDLTYNGRTDAFVAKLKTDGSGLVYAGYLGGDGDEAGHGIAVDANGNAYVTGWTTSTQATFPVVGALDPTFNGALDAFVAKVNAAGTALSYCGYLGGDDDDEGLGIAVDASGRAYVTGLTASTQTTFPDLVGPGLIFKGLVDAFVARVKADGSGLEYAGYLGGSGDDQGRSIAVDASGNAYVTGLTTSTEASFAMVGTLGPTFKGGTDAFVAKLNSTGAAVSYSGFIGGGGIDEAYGIAVDGAGSAYITGRTTSNEATFPKLVGPDLTFNGALDAFVAKINPAGSALSYAGYIGGSGDDEGFAIAVDSAGNAVVTGRTASSETTFPKANAFDLTLNGASDGFLAKVNPAGSALNYAGYLGGNGLEEGFGAAVNGLRQVYLAGRSTSAESSFPTLVGPGLKFGGAADAFVLRVDDTSVVCPALTINPATLPNGLQGVSYNQMLSGSGGVAPYSFTVSGNALPPNLMLLPTGAFAGASSQAGSFNFTVQVTDANGCTGTRAFTLVIIPCPTITLSPGTLNAGQQFAMYTQTLTASGGSAPYSFSVSTGALPAGLTLSTGGTLAGTPTATGSFNFTVTATDANLCQGAQAYALTINASPGLMFYPLDRPVRLLDTRNGATACFMPNTPITGGAERTQMAWGTCEGLVIPNTAQAITGNITPVQSGGGFLTLFPSNAARPLVASSNYNPNEIVNNVFTVGLGPDGAFKIYAHNTSEVVVDVTGYYALPSVSGLYFHPLPHPVRLLETRPTLSGCFTPGTPITGGTNRTQQARGLCDGVTIPTGAKAIVGNATVVAPLAGGYLTFYPAGAAQPLVSNGNYLSGDIVNSPFTVGLASNGEFNIFTTATTHLVVDVLGYYSQEATDVNGAGLRFTPLTHPVRLLETRAGQPVGCFLPGLPLTGGVEYAQPARGVCDGLTIPVTALGVVGNATVVNANGGFLTLWPSNAARPLVASSNFNAGQIVNRHVTVGLGPDGAFKLYSHLTTDLVIDLSGYFAP